jgi:hypothetical protein
VRIHRITDLLEDAPALVVLDEARDPGVSESFRSPRPTEAPVGRPLILRVQLATLDTPDTIELGAARAEGKRFEFEVEHHSFGGILGANVQSKAVLEAHLGALVPGTYEVVITTRVLSFFRLDHPEDAQLHVSNSQLLAFSIKR